MIEQIAFYMIASMTVFAALGVVLMPSRGGVGYSCLCLAVCLTGVGGIFAMLGSGFLFGAQILVCVCGIPVLLLIAAFLSGGMVTTRSSTADSSRTDTSPRQTNRAWMAAVLISGIFLWSVSKIAVQFADLTPGPGLAGPYPTTIAITTLIFGDYVVCLALAAVIFLAALTGAVLSRKGA